MPKSKSIGSAHAEETLTTEDSSNGADHPAITRKTRSLDVYVVKLTMTTYKIVITLEKTILGFWHYNIRDNETDEGILTERVAQSVYADLYARNSDFAHIMRTVTPIDGFQGAFIKSTNNKIMITAMLQSAILFINTAFEAQSTNGETIDVTAEPNN